MKVQIPIEDLWQLIPEAKLLMGKLPRKKKKTIKKKIKLIIEESILYYMGKMERDDVLAEMMEYNQEMELYD